MSQFIKTVIKRRNSKLPIGFARVMQSEGSYFSSKVPIIGATIGRMMVDLPAYTTRELSTVKESASYDEQLFNKASKTVEAIFGAHSGLSETEKDCMITYIADKERQLDSLLTQQHLQHEKEIREMKENMMSEERERKESLVKCFHLSELAKTNQRWALEQFSYQCVDKYLELVEVEKETSADKKTSALEAVAKKHMAWCGGISCFQEGPDEVEMIHANQLLLCKEVRKVLFQELGMADVPFPGLPVTELYGYLRSDIHQPKPQKIYISEDFSKDMKAFLVGVARRLDTPTEMYACDPFDVYMGKMIFQNSTSQGVSSKSTSSGR